MKKLTNKRKSPIGEEEAAYRRDMLKILRNSKTSRGVPFWNNHLASEFLKKDETSGVAKEMRPKELRKSRKEYQDFSLSVFYKHIYQERTKQLAAPYWQHKRNKNEKKNSKRHKKWWKNGMSFIWIETWKGCFEIGEESIWEMIKINNIFHSSRGGDAKDDKEDWDQHALYFLLEDDEKLIVIVVMLVNQVRLWSAQKTTIHPNLRSFWLGPKIARRHFIGGSRASIYLGINFAMT